MHAQVKRKTRQLRQFKVGIVGASSREVDAFKRILMVTQYRTRCYQTLALSEKDIRAKSKVDIVICCSPNPNVVLGWENECYANETDNSRPLVILSRPNSAISGKYQLTSPINPSKLIKLLDHYTIKELNFLPEFEIGHDEAELHDLAVSGLKILRADKQVKCNGHTKVDGDKRKALVVDDSLAVRRQMQLEFDLLNDDLDLAENAEQALQAIQSNKYDVIFLDIVMPGMDGYTVCKKIKRDPINRDTPVILLTSKSSSFDKIKGTLAGCDAYLVKPINHNEFNLAYQQNVINNAQGANHASQ